MLVPRTGGTFSFPIPWNIDGCSINASKSFDSSCHRCEEDTLNERHYWRDIRLRKIMYDPVFFSPSVPVDLHGFGSIPLWGGWRPWLQVAPFSGLDLWGPGSSRDPHRTGSDGGTLPLLQTLKEYGTRWFLLITFKACHHSIFHVYKFFFLHKYYICIRF